jgi:metallo-beta-lactamase family protein
MTTLPVGGDPGPTVTFWGAARSVTGSMHLVEVGDRKILLDCGSDRRKRSDGRTPPSFPFAPAEVDAVILSHAHIDHCGNLPNLVKQGFTGPVYCTPPTRDLLAVILANSARFQEEEAVVLSIVGSSDASATPAFTRGDAGRVLYNCVGVPYEKPTEILPGVELRFVEAGHILGAAMVALRIEHAGRESTLTFTGDLGRRGVPFVRPAAPIPLADVVLCESTYGGTTHEPLEQMARTMSDVVRRTVERGGKVLIPAFSLGRTQLVVHYLQQWARAGLLPRLPVYVDGSLAPELAEVHRRHLDCLDPEAARQIAEAGGGHDVRHIRSREESEEMSVRRGPCVIIAPSGMCDGGRILHHLKNHLDDPRCSVVLVSFQAPGTLGEKLLEPRPTVRFHGRDWNLWADVVKLEGFSGHAGHDDLMAALTPLLGRTKRIRLVHGEVDRAEALATALRHAGFDDVSAPFTGESVSLC